MCWLRCSAQLSLGRIQIVFDGGAGRTHGKNFLANALHWQVGPSEASTIPRFDGRREEVRAARTFTLTKDQSWTFPAEGRLLISGLPRLAGHDKMCKSQADNYAGNGVYGLNRPIHCGLRVAVDSVGLSSCGGANQCSFSSMTSNEVPSHGFGS